MHELGVFCVFKLENCASNIDLMNATEVKDDIQVVSQLSCFVGHPAVLLE